MTDYFLESERLVLRRFHQEDLDELCLLNSDPEVMRYINGGIPETREKVQRFLQWCMDYYKDNPGLGLFAAIGKDNTEFLGWLGLKHLENTSEIGIGYRLHKRFWNSGYATEGSRRLISYGFNSLQLDPIVAVALPDNKASLRVMEKCGLKYIENRVHYRYDCVYYIITRGDWEKGN